MDQAATCNDSGVHSWQSKAGLPGDHNAYQKESSPKSFARTDSKRGRAPAGMRHHQTPLSQGHSAVPGKPEMEPSNKMSSPKSDWRAVFTFRAAFSWLRGSGGPQECHQGEGEPGPACSDPHPRHSHVQVPVPRAHSVRTCPVAGWAFGIRCQHPHHGHRQVQVLASLFFF